MADILRPPLLSQRQLKRAIASVDQFSRALTLGINPNAAIARLHDSAPQRKRRLSLDTYPNLLGTALAAAPAGLGLPLRSGRLFESAPRKQRWQADALTSQGFMVDDGPEAKIASLTDSAPRRVRRLSLDQSLDLLSTTLAQTGLQLPLLAGRYDLGAPALKRQARIEALSRPLTLGIIASYSASVSESAAGVDALASALVAVGALSESGSAADADSAANTAVGSISESGSAADAASGALIAVAALTESASGADSVTSSTGNDSLLSESASATDALTSVVTAVGVLAETGSAADLATSIATLIGQLSEAGSSADSINGSLAGNTYNVSIGETASSTDAVTGVLLAAAAIAETASAIDAHSALLQAAASLIETGAAADVTTYQFNGLCSLSEVATAIDSLTTNPRIPPRGSRIVVVSAQTHRINIRPN